MDVKWVDDTHCIGFAEIVVLSQKFSEVQTFDNELSLEEEGLMKVHLENSGGFSPDIGYYLSS